MAISPTYWDFGDEREDPIHRIHAYPAKFPAFITTKALHYAQRNGVTVDLVADVFCGCGTTAVEALRNGKSFWGCDINPVATLIAHVKTRSYDDGGLDRKFEAIKRHVQDARPLEEDDVRIPDRLHYWFDDDAINDLLRLYQAITASTPPKSRYRGFFLCAFSNILKPTSRWLTKSIKPQVDPDKAPRAVSEAFATQVALMRKANSQRISALTSVGTDSSDLPVAAQVNIRTRNFLASRLPSCQPDLIVTSPPYVTSYNYADIHQLSALWLGFASDYRSLRKDMLGNGYRIRPLSRPAIGRLGTLALNTCDTLERRDGRKARAVARYFFDMNKAVTKCWRMLKTNGMAVFVIGNTKYHGITIDNRKYLEHCMDSAGFREIEAYPRKVSLKIMTPYRDARGRFTRDAAKRKVYAKEFVVIGRRK
ncbi:MAG: class I SAM-dependent methyltransferase [Gemmatimonadota bacterium]|nr:class I SAM-dependent methyltransferase [Gemmatimonadota bacterium]